MSLTKYEKDIAARNERAYRELNITKLKEQIKNARDILAVIPLDGWQTDRERQTVQAEIKRLSDFIEDEERAYKATFEDEQQAEEAIKKMML